MESILFIKICGIISSLGCFSKTAHTRTNQKPYTHTHTHTHTHTQTQAKNMNLTLACPPELCQLPQTQTIDFPWMHLNMVAAAPAALRHPSEDHSYCRVLQLLWITEREPIDSEGRPLESLSSLNVNDVMRGLGLQFSTREWMSAKIHTHTHSVCSLRL